MFGILVFTSGGGKAQIRVNGRFQYGAPPTEVGIGLGWLVAILGGQEQFGTLLLSKNNSGAIVNDRLPSPR